MKSPPCSRWGGIAGTFVFTVLRSLHSPKGKAKTAGARLRRTMASRQGLNAASAPAAQRDAAYSSLVDNEKTVGALPEEYRALINERQTLRDMLAQAHCAHAVIPFDYDSRHGPMRCVTRGGSPC